MSRFSKFFGFRCNSKKDEEKKKKERTAVKLARAIIHIRSFEILHFEKALKESRIDLSFYTKLLMGSVLYLRRVTEENLAKSVLGDEGHNQKEKQDLVEKLEDSGVIPHGIPVRLLAERYRLRHALIQHWMKDEVRMSKTCREALQKIEGTYLVYFHETGSHIIEPRILRIEIDPATPPMDRFSHTRQRSNQRLATSTRGGTEVGTDDLDTSAEKEDERNDLFHVTEFFRRNGTLFQRNGPLFPFDRFHSAILVSADDTRIKPKVPRNCIADDLDELKSAKVSEEKDVERLIVEDDGGDIISGTFQYKEAIGRFRGLKTEEILSKEQTDKLEIHDIEDLSRLDPLDRQVVDKLLSVSHARFRGYANEVRSPPG